MSQHDEKHVIVSNCTILWDAITKPDTNESGVKHNLKVAVHPQSPDISLLEQMANAQLLAGVFQGTLPAIGTMPVGTLGPTEYGGQFNGWRVFTTGTYRGVPDIYNDSKQLLDPMQWAPLMYPGQNVDLLVHVYENNGKVKGIACGLDSVRLNLALNAARQNFGGPTVDTAGAFGQGAAGATATPAPSVTVTPQQAHEMLPGGAPAPAPNAAPAPGAPAKRLYNGVAYDEAQLQAGGHTPEMITTYPLA